MIRRAVMLALLAIWPGSAQAEWLEASSAHFVVYADDSERDIRRLSEQLERYDAAIALITGMDIGTPSPSNRVSVYVVSNARQVRSLHGGDSRFINGFYRPRAGGSLAIVPRLDGSGKAPTFSMITLLHEYAHHFMFTNSGFAMPRWYAEGGAEFLASASFGADGTVEIGKPAAHRAVELLRPDLVRDVVAADLIDPSAYDKRKSKAYDAFYGKSWLLFHYLAFDKTRIGQVETYNELMTNGKSSREAGLQAFGDFAKLEADLDAYLRQRRMSQMKLPPDLLKTGPIAVRRLSAGEAAVMPVRVRSRVGVDEEQAKAVLIDARAVAARFPGDPAVLAALAEAEHDAGNDREAVAAADAAIAEDPAQINAYVQKGLSLVRLAESARPAEEAEAYRAAFRPFLAINKLENDHPLPLIYSFRIQVAQGREPTALALRGLERATELAPFDLGLRMTLAMQHIRFGQVDKARFHLKPIAFNPHGGGLAQIAQQALARLDRDPKWDGSGLADPDDVDAVAAGEQGDGDQKGAPRR